MGADDYIKKPFSQRLLIARIRALLRRRELDEETKDDNDKDNIIVRDNLIMDQSRHQCTWKGEPLNLTVTEFLILEALATNPGAVKSREQLMNAAFGEETSNQDDRSIDHHLKRIRKKFKKTDNKFNFISTIYGIGYKFSE